MFRLFDSTISSHLDIHHLANPHPHHHHQPNHHPEPHQEYWDADEGDHHDDVLLVIHLLVPLVPPAERV